MACLGSTFGKHQGRPQPSGSTSEARRGWDPSPRGVDGRRPAGCVCGRLGCGRLGCGGLVGAGRGNARAMWGEGEG
ncbi:hypothetical protein T492DRAFT_892859 [Pavlovales sp. CCMP2436]|nr:hypothetical protein T492DRAFT_892859 [Pavlovales sp. CCMP2436]